MKPQVTFANPERAARLALTEAWTGRDDFPAKIDTSFPSAPLADDVTHVQVDLENSDGADYPISERAVVRVVIHTGPNDRTLALSQCSVALTLLCSHPGNADVAGFFPRSGRSAVSVDPDTGNHMCWFRVQLNLKATPLAS